MNLQIHRARSHEHHEIGQLTVRAYAEWERDPGDPYTLKLADAATREAEAELWVAELDGTLAGTVTWCPQNSAWNELAGHHEREFRMLAVDPAARGAGVGRALVEAMIQRSRDDGAAAMAISSLPTMASAHRLYARFGFVRVPERDFWPVPHVECLALVLQL